MLQEQNNMGAVGDLPNDLAEGQIVTKIPGTNLSVSTVLVNPIYQFQMLLQASRKGREIGKDLNDPFFEFFESYTNEKTQYETIVARNLDEPNFNKVSNDVLLTYHSPSLDAAEKVHAHVVSEWTKFQWAVPTGGEADVTVIDGYGPVWFKGVDTITKEFSNGKF